MKKEEGRQEVDRKVDRKFVLDRKAKTDEGKDVLIDQSQAMLIANDEAKKRGFNKVSLQQGSAESFEFLFYTR